MEKLPYISKKVKEYPHVGILSPTNEDSPLKGKRKLYKFLDLESFFKTLDNGLMFSEPYCWPDKFESRFYHANFSHLSCDEPMPRQVFACCMTTAKCSEVAWKNYLRIASGSNQLACPYCVRLTLKRAPLLKLFSQWAKNNGGFAIYEGGIEYYRRFTIENMHLPNQKGSTGIHNAFFRKGVFTLDDFLSLLLIKRDDFKHEEEVRYFVVPKERIPVCRHFIKLTKLDWSQIIENITLVEPYALDGIFQSAFQRIREKIYATYPELKGITIEKYSPYADSISGTLTIIP